MTSSEHDAVFLQGSPFANRVIRLRDGGTVDLGDGDFVVPLPDNRVAHLRLRAGLPLFPINTSQGEAPAEYLIRQLETSSTKHALNSYNGFRLFCRFFSEEESSNAFSWRDVGEGTLLRYLAYLRSENREYEFARIRHFYKWATDAEYQGW